MKYAFRVITSELAAKVLSAPQERDSLVNHAVTEAEKKNLKDGDTATFEVDNIVCLVLWGKKTVYIITKQEADERGVPRPSTSN